MIQRVNREQPFQVLASNFSIGPSNSGYDLEISADGVNYTTLFSVGANVTRMVTGVANGSYYRLGGNTDEDVAINWRTQCNDGGSGGGIGSQGPQGPAAEGGDNTILKSVSAAPATMELNDVAVLGNNLSQLTGYEDVVSAYTLVKMYNGSFAKDAGAVDYVSVRVTGNTISEFTINGSHIHTPLGNITPGSEVYTDWTDVTEYGGVSTGIMMKYDAGNDELDLKVPSGFSIEGRITNKSGAELGDLSTYVQMTSEEEHFQGDPIYEQYAKRSELSDLSEYWTSAETQTAIQNEATQLVGYVDALQEQTISAIPQAVSELINDEEFVSSANLKTINNESIVGTGNISIQGGGGGDNHILKSLSGTPANLGSGDVYAITIPSADTIYGTTWTDSGEQNIEYDRYGNGNPQAIRISTTGLRFHWACEEYGSDTYISFENDAISFENDGGWTEISSTHYVFDEWSGLTEGKRIHVEYLNGYFYFYTEDGSQIWIWEVTENESGNVFEGEVTPGHGEYNYLYQASKILEPNVIIELEGNASVDGTLYDPEQVVTNNVGQMKISFYNNSNIQGVICDLESNGTYFHLHYDSTANDWTLYDSDEENILINITDGESDSADFGDGNVYLSYSGGVLTAYTDYDKAWMNWDMGDSHEGFTAQEFVKVSDLPNNLATRLLPENPGAEDMVIYSSEAWRTTPRAAVFIDGLYAFQNNWDDDGSKYIITRTGYANVQWEKLDLSISNLKAVSALPVTTTDGDVIPYANASGYGIVQAQSGTTGYAWVEGNTEITGNTQIRVPYTSNDSGYIEFTFENSTDYHNLWWHYDDGNDPHWDGDNVPIDEQVDGEFSGQDGDGETITCVRSGDYLVVTFGSPVVSVNNVYNTEVYTEVFLPTYKEVAFYDEIGGGESSNFKIFYVSAWVGNYGGLFTEIANAIDGGITPALVSEPFGISGDLVFATLSKLERWGTQYASAYFTGYHQDTNKSEISIYYPSIGYGGTTSNIQTAYGTFRNPIKNYSMNTASTTTLGGVKIGSGISVDSNGVISVSGAVTSNTITTIWKGSQAGYDALVQAGTTDDETIYYVLSNDGTYYTQYIGGIRVGNPSV